MPATVRDADRNRRGKRTQIDACLVARKGGSSSADGRHRPNVARPRITGSIFRRSRRHLPGFDLGLVARVLGAKGMCSGKLHYGTRPILARQRAILIQSRGFAEPPTDRARFSVRGFTVRGRRRPRDLSRSGANVTALIYSGIAEPAISETMSASGVVSEDDRPHDPGMSA